MRAGEQKFSKSSLYRLILGYILSSTVGFGLARSRAAHALLVYSNSEMRRPLARASQWQQRIQPGEHRVVHRALGLGRIAGNLQNLPIFLPTLPTLFTFMSYNFLLRGKLNSVIKFFYPGNY